MRVLVTGGTGFIGQALCPYLIDQGHQVAVLSRNPRKAATKLPPSVMIRRELADLAEFAPKAIVNLAGEPIANARWTGARKQKLVLSRTQTTHSLVDFLKALPEKPDVFVSASAVGFYGNRGQEEMTESSSGRGGFSHELCERWEAAARLAEGDVARLCIVRIGLVLDQPGGLLDRMVLPFKLGVGGRFGSGEQYMPWIHRQDMVRIIGFLLASTTAEGIYNASAPNPVTNQVFSQTLAEVLHRPMLLPVPSSVLRMAFGEMSELMLEGARMVPQRLVESGFEFNHPNLKEALTSILK